MTLRRTVDPRPGARGLDSLNFFPADVRDGIGPFLAIWLMATHHWDAASIGLAMGTMPLTTVLMPGPAGAMAEAVRAKRALHFIRRPAATIKTDGADQPPPRSRRQHT